MAWERRANREYYYRTLRQENRIVKRYFGCGQRAHQAAEADKAAREARHMESLRRAERRRPVSKLAAHFNPFDTILDQLVAFSLVCAGWKRHHRQWIVRKL